MPSLEDERDCRECQFESDRKKERPETLPMYHAAIHLGQATRPIKVASLRAQLNQAQLHIFIERICLTSAN